ncbi:hypothetical protein WK80_22230 [Burkholderia multivorans]|uniref:hypothetical protein n=1 Tax=Burkholderia multivorans TaxID=87883 RepID=UPI000754B32A|nr:hypothetical protein [Burkholderia multivorans]KVV22310.1 hypothetical protein WK80_22230 [Burkholderia multivorans]MBU9203124.1 hypothetical protein [Burkholderia multivorans]MCA8385363.1 hypothetical protein [Burkholderia multivorans]
MPSQYLQSVDFANFGVPTATAQQVTQASVLIDAFLRRPAGLLWVADSNGNPAYMSSLSPSLTLTSEASFGPGNQVTVQVTGPVNMVQVGDVVVLDKATPSLMEAVQISSISGNLVTLGTTAANAPQGVQFAHSAGCTMDLGMVLTEQRYLPKQRSTVMLSNTPVMRVIGGTGRYAYGRRGDAGVYNADNYNLLASINKFGGPPAWEIWPANTAAGIDVQTGELWVPAGIMLVYYSEVKVRYVAGFQYSGLPDCIKLACAQLVTALANDPGIGNYKSVQAGDTKMERFAATNLSDDVKAMLVPYQARFFA